MSLINDALKRAKQAQQQAQPPPSPGLQFRPVEAAQEAKPRFDWVAPAVVAVVGILALIFIWPWAQRTASTKIAAPTPQNVVAAKEVSALVPAVATPQPSPTPQIAVTPVPPKPSASAEPTPGSPIVANETNSATTAVAISETPPPKPAPLKLQAIVYNPTRPSAMINGRTLFIGDKFGDSRVLAIDQESATLAGHGQTNVLKLSE